MSAEVCGTCEQPIEDTDELGWVHVRNGAPICGNARLRVVPKSHMRDPDDCAHQWSAWQINDFFAAREDRFCPFCGSMETQTICAAEGTCDE